MTDGRSCSSVSSTQRSTATRNIVMPVSAASIAVVALVPRSRKASAIADAMFASLMSSRSRSSGLAAMTACRRWANSRTRLQFGASAFERSGDRFDRRGAGRCLHDQADEAVLQLVRAVEEDFALIGEVPEEGPLSQPGLLGDLFGGGLVEATLAEEGEGRLHKPPGAVRLPTSHAAHRSGRRDRG